MTSNTEATTRSYLVAMERAVATGRDFYLAMRRRFITSPEVEQVWRVLMLDEARDIEKLRNVLALLSDADGVQPVDAAALSPCKAVSRCINDERIAAVATLADAYELACEYETTGIHTAIDLALSRYFPRTGTGRTARPERPRDPAMGIALITMLLGDPAEYPGMKASA